MTIKGRESMAFDGLFTYSITNELQSELKSGKISKIYQPSKYEILLNIRANRKNHKLLLCAHPTYTRIQLTEHSFETPQVPPTFCMFLRKHLEGGVVEDISQVEMERIVKLRIRSRNEIGDESTKILLIELMGRHSNIILLDENEKILSCLKHISSTVNRHRIVAPGFEYVYPPNQEKRNPFSSTEEDILIALDFNAGKIDNQLVQQFAGVSPTFAKEVTSRAGLVNERTVPPVFLSMIHDVKENSITPQMITTDNKEYFYLLPLTHIKGNVTEYQSLSELLDRFFFGKADRDRVKQQIIDLERFISNELSKNIRKQKKLEKSLSSAHDAEKYQKLGELLTANIYAIQKGMNEVEIVDYYDENQSTITISLDVRKSPSENAQSYFQKYQKSKNAIIHIHEQLEKNDEEIKYFELLLQQIEYASQKDVEEIREELAEQGYIKARKLKKQKKSTKPVIEQYLSTDGTEILIGKNNTQNDYLTNKLAHRDEIWLHTKDIPGSHVIIRSKEPSEQTLLEAANLSAYFSKARTSSAVPVDYTAVRYVKKPSGAKPGFVIYTNQQTLFITPDEEMIWKLQKS